MRIIGRLDIKNEYVIKGINFEGLRKVGKPLDLAKKYYDLQIDELIFVDTVASLYKRNNLFNIIKSATENIFCPLTLGGGIRSLKDIETAMSSGVDKVAINSYALEEPNFIADAVKNFGSSNIVLNIEAKQISNSKWEVYKYYGREKTGIDLCEWIKKVQNLGCGEIILTSIDKEGAQGGMDFNLLDHIIDIIERPLIFSGGLSDKSEIIRLKKYQGVSVSLASGLHYNKINIADLKNA